MTPFFISAAALVTVCLLWLLHGLYRSQTSASDQESVNVSLARERQETLNAALASNAIDQQTFDYENEQLAYDLAADLRPAGKPERATKGGQLSAGIIILAFIPIASGALYLQLGNPAAITQSKQASRNSQNNAQAPALGELLPRLEERLSKSPDDVDGWRLLGRSYLSVNQFSDAQRAFEKALALEEEDVATLAQLAESIAMTQGGNLAGKPLAYLERAEAIAPSHEHTMWLLAIGQQQAGEHEAALIKFDQLATMAAGNADALTTIEQMRKRSHDAQNGSPTVLDGNAAIGTQQPETPQTQGKQAVITVSVNLGSTARAATPGSDTVYIYAKATQGPPMPLAVSRVLVRDLPVTVTLDDSMAMIPSMTLSVYPNVTVGARVSASGDPIAQAGDWYGEQKNVDSSQSPELQITINTQVN